MYYIRTDAQLMAVSGNVHVALSCVPPVLEHIFELYFAI